MKKLLFVCNVNINRSPSAAELFKDRFETRSAGLSELSKIQLNKELLEWSNIVVVMEEWMRTEISIRFPREYMQNKIISLEIPDVYSYMQPELVNLLKEKINMVY